MRDLGTMFWSLCAKTVGTQDLRCLSYGYIHMLRGMFLLLDWSSFSIAMLETTFLSSSALTLFEVNALGWVPKGTVLTFGAGTF